MAENTQVISLTTSKAGKANFSTQTVRSTKARSKTTDTMAKERRRGKTEPIMKETLSMDCTRARERSLFLGA